MEKPLERALLLAARLTVFFAALACVPALLVPIGLVAEGDALDYRVPMLKWILRHGSYPNWPSTYVDDFPLLGELLMLPFFAFKQEFARLVPIFAYFGIGAFTALIGTELLPEKTERRTLFWFLFASVLGLQPVLVPAAHVMVDNTAACFALGSLYFLLKRSYHTSALFLAAALATRYTIWGAAPGALAALFFLEKQNPQRGKILLSYAALASIGAAPFLLRNFILHGNPVYPLLNSWFGLPTVAAFDGWGRGRGPVALLLFPYDLLYTHSFVRELFDTKSYTNGFFVYRVGYLFYAQLALLSLVLLKQKKFRFSDKTKAAVLFGLGHFLLWWFGSQQMRFLGCGMALLNVFLLCAIYARAPKAALVAFALLPIFSIACVQQEPWNIWRGKAEAFRDSGYAQSAVRCLARAGLAPDSVVGFASRDALLGFFDFDYVYLSPNNLYIADGAESTPDFIYTGLDFRAREGYLRWPPDKPCLLKRQK